MTSEQISVSFGQFLKSARIAGGIDLHSLSVKTKISLKVLRQIENEEHGGLPDPAFVKGFLKLFAAAVKADEERVLELYRISRAEYEKVQAMAGDGYPNGGRFWVNMILSTAALGAIITLSMYIISDSGIPKRVEDPAGYSIENSSVSPLPVSGAGSVRKTESRLKQAMMEKWRLSVEALDETWMKVIIDDQPYKEYKLGRSDRLRLTADNRFNLLIGDSAAVKLDLNGNPVVFHAKKGQLVTLDLP